MPTLEHLAGFSPLVFALFGFAPQDTRPAGRQSDGSVIVPTHQTLRPAGDQVEFPGRPTDLLLLDRGRTLAVKNRTDLVLIEVDTRTIRQALVVPKGGLSYHGIAASSSGDRIFVTGSDDQLWIAKREKGVATWEEPVHLPGPGGRGASAPGGIALRGEELFVTLSRNNTLGVVSLADRKLTTQIPVGVAPYAVLVEGDRAYVTNWGGRHPREGEPTDTSAGTKVLVDEQTNVAASGTMSVVDLKEGKAIEEIELGLHPCGMALDREKSLLYVANANSDTVSVVDLKTLKVARTLAVRPRKELPFGSAPNALALAPDGKRLFVANGTNNAIAVLDPARDGAPLGFLPVGWYPGAVLFEATRGRLFVANTKGLGSLQKTTGAIGFNSRNHLGSVSILTDLSEKALADGTRVTEETNRFTSLRLFLEPPDAAARPTPIPARHGEPSVFEHVLYVIKENRTYDQVLGDQPRGNGDASLCLFGRQVTPNHHALTDEFVLLDNFNCGGVLSADGHQWTNEAYVTDYLEKSFGGFARSYPYEGDDPLAYAPTGFIWDNALSHRKTFRCYGEMVTGKVTPAGNFREIYDDFIKGGGKFTIKATAHIDAIAKNMCETSIGFPLRVPDVYRAAQFITELTRFEKEGRLPNLMIMLLPGDHTSGTSPGLQTPAAALADNDLALGRVVEAVSKSRFWPKTCIFVVEDDPQAGWDHVDAHRTVALVVSPYTRRGAVVSERYTQAGMVKTIELILGLPPMNQMDLLATEMRECFTGEANLTPYSCKENKVPVDQLNASLDTLKGPALEDALASLKLDLDDLDRADEDTFNRILWRTMKGDAPYPGEVARGEKKERGEKK